MPSSGVSGYAAIHSRVRVMYSSLLSAEDWTSLCDVADLQGLVAFLKDTPYGQYLTGIEDKDITPKWAIHQIKHRLADVYLTIIHSVPAHTRSLAVQLFRHYEVDNLKAILRGIVTNSSWEQVQEILFPLGSLSVLPAQQMMEAGDVEAAISQLSSTPYYETLSHALKRYSDERSLFPLEVALDLSYWQKLWAKTGQLPGRDRAEAMRVVGPLVDMTNLMWAIRYRIYYHLSEEEIINYTLPFGHRVRDEDIRTIAVGGDLVQVLDRFYPGISDIESLLDEPEHGLPKLELQLQRRIQRQFKAIFTSYPFQIGLPLAFAVLNELELQDLTVVLEAKSAQMPTDRFVPYLLMNTELESRVAV
jgi:V/A-type H+-transporting ATPase subunit C